MGKMRSALAAGVVGATVLAGAGPAAAADEPLEVTSTGLVEGQAVGPRLVFHPTWTGSGEVTRIEVGANNATRAYTSWPKGVMVPIHPLWNDTDVLVTVRIFAADGTSAEASTTVRADTVNPSATFSPTRAVVGGVVTITAANLSGDVDSITLLDTAKSLPIQKLTAAPWSFQWDTVNGPKRVTMTVVDRAGNLTSTELSLTTDNVAPQISEVEFYYGAVAGRVRGEVQMHVTFKDASGVSRTKWVVDGKDIGGYYNGPSTWISGDVATHDFGTTPRTVPVEIHAWDRAGNETVKSFTVVVDGDAPAVTVLSPARNTLVRGTQVTSSVRATDPAGISHGILNNHRYVWADSGTLLKDTVATGRDGQRNLVWQVADNLGNIRTVTQVVIVDNTKPALSIKAPKNGAKVTGTVKIAAAAADRNGVNRVELLVNGKVVAKDSTAAYRFTLNPRKYGKKFKVTVRAYDRAGNVAYVSTRTWKR